MTKSKNILMVDDDRTTVRLLQEYLDDAGFNVRVAFSGSQGLTALKKQKFDIVIVDYRLPDIDGVRVAEECHTRSPETILVFLTGMKKDQLATHISGRMQYSVISKPCRPSQLLSHLRKLC